MEKETALKILRELHDKVLFSERTALETFIPELSESEDERIRKTIIELVEDYKESSPCGGFGGLKFDKLLTWLEKQGEQKSIINVSLRDVILSIWDLEDEWEELTKCSNLTVHGTKLDFIQKHWNERESLRGIAWLETTTNEKN